jgi:catechol 2,3-dioxygenase-like lactoylglutathione lyase family enzyme
MAIVLDHTIVPVKNKIASAGFFAEIFGLSVKLGQGHFAQVQINESLTLDFAEESKPRSHHYAFHTSEAEFETIFSRVKAKGLPYGSGPYNHADGQIYTRRGGCGFYFEDPNGHLLEVMTVPETGSHPACDRLSSPLARFAGSGVAGIPHDYAAERIGAGLGRGI